MNDLYYLDFRVQLDDLKIQNTLCHIGIFAIYTYLTIVPQ